MATSWYITITTRHLLRPFPWRMCFRTTKMIGGRPSTVDIESSRSRLSLPAPVRQNLPAAMRTKAICLSCLGSRRQARSLQRISSPGKLYSGRIRRTEQALFRSRKRKPTLRIRSIPLPISWTTCQSITPTMRTSSASSSMFLWVTWQAKPMYM